MQAIAMDTDVMANLMSNEDVLPSEKPLSVEALFTDCMPSSFPNLLPACLNYDVLGPSDLFSDPHDELGIIGSGLPWDLVGELEGAQHAFDHDDEDESDDLNTSLEAGSLLDAVTDTSVSTPMASELMAHLVSPTTPLITSPVKSLVTVMAPAVTTVTPLGTTTQLATSVKPVGTNSATPLAKVVTSDVLNDEIEGAILTAEDLLGFDGKLESIIPNDVNSLFMQLDEGPSDVDVDVVGCDSDTEEPLSRSSILLQPGAHQLKQAPTISELASQESEVMRLLTTKTPVAKVTQSAPSTPPATPSKEMINKIKNSNKAKSIIMLPTALPSKGERGGKAVELATPLMPRKLQRLRQDVTQSAPASPTGHSKQEEDSDSSDVDILEVSSDYFEVTVDHDYCQNVPQTRKSPAKPAPISKPVPVSSKTLPVSNKPPPVSSKPLPASSKPLPLSSKPALLSSKSVPVSGKPISMNSKPAVVSVTTPMSLHHPGDKYRSLLARPPQTTLPPPPSSKQRKLEQQSEKAGAFGRYKTTGERVTELKRTEHRPTKDLRRPESRDSPEPRRSVASQLHSSPVRKQPEPPQHHSSPDHRRRELPQHHSSPDHRRREPPQTHSSPDHRRREPPQNYSSPVHKRSEPLEYSSSPERKRHKQSQQQSSPARKHPSDGRPQPEQTRKRSHAAVAPEASASPRQMSAAVWSGKEVNPAPRRPMSAAVWSPHDLPSERTWGSPYHPEPRSVSLPTSSASSPARSPVHISPVEASPAKSTGAEPAAEPVPEPEPEVATPDSEAPTPADSPEQNEELEKPKKAKIKIEDYVKSRLGRTLRYKTDSPETGRSPSLSESSRSSGVDNCTPQESMMKTLLMNEKLNAELRRYEARQKAEQALEEYNRKVREANRAKNAVLQNKLADNPKLRVSSSSPSLQSLLPPELMQRSPPNRTVTSTQSSRNPTPEQRSPALVTSAPVSRGTSPPVCDNQASVAGTTSKKSPPTNRSPSTVNEPQSEQTAVSFLSAVVQLQEVIVKKVTPQPSPARSPVPSLQPSPAPSSSPGLVMNTPGASQDSPSCSDEEAVSAPPPPGRDTDPLRLQEAVPAPPPPGRDTDPQRLQEAVPAPSPPGRDADPLRLQEAVPAPPPPGRDTDPLRLQEAVPAPPPPGRDTDPLRLLEAVPAPPPPGRDTDPLRLQEAVPAPPPPGRDTDPLRLQEAVPTPHPAMDTDPLQLSTEPQPAGDVAMDTAPAPAPSLPSSQVSLADEESQASDDFYDMALTCDQVPMTSQPSPSCDSMEEGDLGEDEEAMEPVSMDLEDASDGEHEGHFSKFEAERSLSHLMMASSDQNSPPYISPPQLPLDPPEVIKKSHAHRNYRKRAKTPEPETFDKLPSYYTANASPIKQSSGKANIIDKLDIGGIPDRDRDPSPDRNEPVFDKLPAYFSCFTNDTKYDDGPPLSKPSTPEPPVSDSRSSTPGLVISSRANSQSRANSCSRPTSRNVSPVASRPTSRHVSPSVSVRSARDAHRVEPPGPSRPRRPHSGSRSRSPGHRSSRGHSSRRHRRSFSSSRSSSRSYSRSRSRSPVRRSHHSRSRHSRRRSRSWSSSRSRSRSPHSRRRKDRLRRERSRSRERRLEHAKWMEQKKQKQIDERRIVYVGRIPKHFTPRDLRKQFSRFGEIEESKVHIRDSGGDNYGFITFVYTCDAYAAIEKGNTVAGMEDYDLCFGGRRQFCKTDYADLDGNMEEEEEMAPVIRRPAAEPSLDFDELLRQAMNRKR